MGNFLGLAPLRSDVMATGHREVGIAHVTVVPDEVGPAERAPAATADDADRGDDADEA